MSAVKPALARQRYTVAMTTLYPAAHPLADRPAGHRVFLPLALLYGALAVPYWTAGHLGWLATGWTAATHAHEMLFGFALAVVGGFLLTRPRRGPLALAVVAWAAGRLTLLADLPPPMAAALALAFPVVLFALAGWPFLRTAKGGRNAVFGPLIGAFALAEGAYWWVGDGGRTGIVLALHLVGLLLFAMGGRIIPAATAGAVRQDGGTLAQRAQPRLEAAGLAGGAMALAATAAAAVGWPGWPVGDLAAALGAALMGGATLLRLSRWRTAAVRHRPDLLSLHLGYGWLGLGWLAVALERVAPGHGAAGWHVLGVGALGTLVAAMAVRATQQREGRPIVLPAAAGAAVAMLAVATLARVAAAGLDHPWSVAALVGAAATWTLALLLILEVVRRMLGRR